MKEVINKIWGYSWLTPKNPNLIPGKEHYEDAPTDICPISGKIPVLGFRVIYENKKN